ncbi:chorismate--pyruvate lyase family protein [Thalassomonas sp. M1454]|uniref:chorismate--pyruvate lyase family protein n=1 Tax=Thalassomonas sp. M1454 TaxID=2594477 RepID=UPI00118028C8|nr:chorismate lyase [Thalassomonas sp. M1454]TRX55194.1 chorismate lyase [Thalassomonas sp. M1454]
MIELQKQFPIGLNVDWVSAKQAPNSQPLNDWLLDPKSLTARLKNQCNEFKVKVIGQRVEPCSSSEANNNIKEGESVLIREVILICDDIPQVFARSLLPLNSLTGEQQALANLGEQPLGQVLFNNPKLHREVLEVARIKPSQRVCELASTLNLSVEHDLWGRRSIFTIEGKPLMVAEVFLPSSPAYIK